MFDTPRDIEFAFKTTDGEKARDIADFIKAKNFGHPSINQGDDGVLWVIVVIHMAINQNLICSISGFMVCLSRLFKVEYDGWGSVIQKR